MVIPVDEARLREVFHSECDEYCASIRRWIQLIPHAGRARGHEHEC